MTKQLSQSISSLACALREFNDQRKDEFQWLKSHCDLATKHDLKEVEKEIVMKLSEIKVVVATVAAQNKEAFGEIGVLIADLNKKIEDLLAGVGDPDVTDEAFLADLQSLQTDAAALAAIVPNVEPPPVEPPTP